MRPLEDVQAERPHISDFAQRNCWSTTVLADYFFSYFSGLSTCNFCGILRCFRLLEFLGFIHFATLPVPNVCSGKRAMSLGSQLGCGSVVPPPCPASEPSRV